MPDAVLARGAAARRYGVDPATGTVGNALSQLTWYDAAGNRIKQRSQEGGGGFEKLDYDGLNQVIRRFIACDSHPESYAQAQVVADDIVLEQSVLINDPAGNLIERRLFERNHDATGTGELNGPDGDPPQARVSYEALYYDAIGRQIAQANYGTNGGDEFERTASPPASSDICLVALTVYFAYDPWGATTEPQMVDTIDPEGTVLRSVYDQAGRLIKTIENFQA